LFSFQDIITSVVGVMLLIIVILLLQLISQMFAAPPSPTMTEQEIRQQIDSIQPVLTELHDSIVELSRARDQSEVLTPSQEQIDAVRSTIDRLETNVAATEKKIEEVQQRIATLQNHPALPQLEQLQQEVDKLIGELDKQPKDLATLQRENQSLKTQRAQPTPASAGVSVTNTTTKTVFIVDYQNVGGQDRITVHPEDGSPRQTFASRTQFTNWLSSRNPNRDHFMVYVRPSRYGQYRTIINDLRSRGFSRGLQTIGEETALFF
jgi:archaellum component FlaC